MFKYSIIKEKINSIELIIFAKTNYSKLVTKNL